MGAKKREECSSLFAIGDSMKISFYKIKEEYVNYLRKYDNKVPHSTEEKSTRPFIGAGILLNEVLYYIPLTSPKEKHKYMHNQVDFHKINEGLWGAINFNNMIPVPDNCLEQINPQKMPITSIKEQEYVNLLKNQLTWCNISENKDIIIKKAQKLHYTIVNGLGYKELVNRCCNFKLLEDVSKNYIL